MYTFLKFHPFYNSLIFSSALQHVPQAHHCTEINSPPPVIPPVLLPTNIMIPIGFVKTAIQIVLLVPSQPPTVPPAHQVSSSPLPPTLA